MLRENFVRNALHLTQVLAIHATINDIVDNNLRIRVLSAFSICSATVCHRHHWNDTRWKQNPIAIVLPLHPISSWGCRQLCPQNSWSNKMFPVTTETKKYKTLINYTVFSIVLATELYSVYDTIIIVVVVFCVCIFFLTVAFVQQQQQKTTIFYLHNAFCFSLVFHLVRLILQFVFSQNKQESAWMCINK